MGKLAALRPKMMFSGRLPAHFATILTHLFSLVRGAAKLLR